MGAQAKHLYIKKATLLAFSFAALFFMLSTPAKSASDQLNFQGRLLGSSGGLVPDGTYHVEFKLYNAVTSSGSAQGSCAGDANCLWTETRSTGNLVTIQNGYYSVYLGDVNALPDIDWSQDVFLGMNIGGAGAVSWDGEMTPRFKLTAVPYAFSADNLDGRSSEDFVQLDPSAIQNVNSATAAIRINQTGAGDLMTLQGGGSDILTVKNNGKVGVGISVPISKLHVYEDNAGTGTTAGLTVENDGAGDALVQYLLTGTKRWVSGIDNSDGDSFKIAASSDPGSDTILKIEDTGSVTIGNASLQGSMVLQDGSGNTATIETVATLGANVTYQFGAAPAGTYEICTDVGNCDSEIQGGNFVGNTSLETSLTGWSAANSGGSVASVARSSAESIHGKYSAAFTYTSAGSNAGYPRLASQGAVDGTFASGDTVTVSWWVKGDAGDTHTFKIYDNGATLQQQEFTMTGNWQRISMTRTLTGATPVTVQGYINPSQASAPTTIYVDAMQIERGGHVTAYVPSADELEDDSVTTATIADGTILGSDLDVTNGSTDDYILTYDSATGGFTWIDPATITGSGGDITGSGTANTLAMFDAAKNIVDSVISQNGSGDVGIGAAANTDAKLSVSKTYSVATGTEEQGIKLYTDFSAADGNLKQGIRVNTRATNASGAIDQLVGGLYLNSANTSGGTVNNSSALWVRNNVVSGASIINAFGLNVQNGTGVGTISNQYGLYITDLTKGTNDYGIRIDGADTQVLWLGAGANNTDSANGIAFGSSRDTNLYRSAVGTLRTNGNFTAGGLITANNGLTVLGTTTIDAVADDNSYTGIVTNDGGVLKYRSIGNLKQDLGIQSTNASGENVSKTLVEDTWYRIATGDAGAGRFGARIIVSTSGGGIAPNYSEYVIQKDWSVGGSIKLVASNGNAGFDGIRIVDDTVLGDSYVDVRATADYTSSLIQVTVIPEVTYLDDVDAVAFTTLAGLGANEIVRATFDGSAANTYSGFSSSDVANLYVLDADGIRIKGTVLADNGSAASPAFGFVNDTNTGLYVSTADTLNISTGGVNRLVVSNTSTQISNDLTVSGTSTFVGLSTFASGIRVNNQTLTNLVGDGLTLSGTTLTATLGTTVDLSSAEVSGTLPVTRGGTGRTSFTAGSILYGNGSSLLGASAVGTSGQCLKSGASGAPTWADCATGSITGSGTVNTIALFSGSSVVGDSILSQSGTTLTADGSRQISFNTGTGQIKIKASTGGWAYGLFSEGSSGTSHGGFGFNGSNDVLSKYYIGPSYNNSYVDLYSTATVFNETGVSRDFRIEGDTDASLLFVDASADRVGIGTTSPDSKFVVNDYSNNYSQVSIGRGFGNAADTQVGFTRWTGTGSDYYSGSITQTNTGLTLNTTSSVDGSGLAQRLVVENDGDVAIDTNTLFVSASGNNVGIGLTNPSGALQVVGDEVRIGNSGSIQSATGDGDLYVEDLLEVDGDLQIASASGYTRSGTSTVWAEINERFFGTTNFSNSDRVIVDVYGGQYNDTSHVRYTIDFRDSVDIDKEIISGDVVAHELKIYSVDAEGTGSGNKHIVGLVFGNGAGGYFSHVVTARELKTGKWFKLSSATEPTAGHTDVTPTATVLYEFTSTGELNLNGGSSSSAAFGFIGDTDTGMYRQSANVLGFSVGGSTKLTVDSQGISIGHSSLAGVLSIHDGSSNTGTFQTQSLTVDRTYTLPDQSGVICLDSGNCAAGYGDITGSGTANTLAMFDAAKNIVNSIITQSGTNVNIDGSLSLGTDVTLSYPGASPGSVRISNGTNGNAGIQFGAAGDTNLYRGGANILRTDDALVIGSGQYIDDDASLGGNNDDWIRFSGYIEVKSNSDNYGIVLRDRDNAEYLGLTQKNGSSYFADTAVSDNYFLRGDGSDVFVSGDLAVETGNLDLNNGQILNSITPLGVGVNYSAGQYNMLNNATNRTGYTVTQTGTYQFSAPQLEALFNGDTAVTNINGDISAATPTGITVDFPTQHTQTGGVAYGWTSRYRNPQNFTVELNTSTDNITFAWETVSSKTGYNEDYFYEKNTINKYIKGFRITVASADGNTGLQFGELFFSTSEGAGPYDELFLSSYGGTVYGNTNIGTSGDNSNLNVFGNLQTGGSTRISNSGALTVTTGSFSGALTASSTLTVSGTSTFVGLSTFASGIRVNNQTLTNLVGDGLTLSGTTLTATLGTTVDLSSAEVSGTLPVTNGGTGRTSFTSGSILYGNGTGLLGVSPIGTSGQCLVSGGSGAPSWTDCATGSITGSGTVNTIALFSGSSVVGNSILTQSGSTVNVGGILAVGTALSNNVSAVATFDGSIIAGNSTDAVLVGYSGSTIQGRSGAGLVNNGQLTLNEFGGNVGIGLTASNEQLEIGGSGRVFIGDGAGGSRSGLLIDGAESNASGNYARLEGYNYGSGPIPLSVNPGGGNVIIAGQPSVSGDDKLELAVGNFDIDTGNLELNDVTRISNSGALTVTTGSFSGLLTASGGIKLPGSNTVTDLDGSGLTVSGGALGIDSSVCTTSGNCGSGDNMVINGDFENDNTNWSNSANITIIDTDSYSGGSSMQVTGSTTLSSLEYIPVDPDYDVLQLELFIKQTANDGSNNRLYAGYFAYDEDKSLITSAPCGSYCYFAAANNTVPNDGAWHKYSATTTGEGTSYPNFPIGTKFVRVLFLANYAGTAGEQILIDHVSVKKINNGPLFVGNDSNSSNQIDRTQVSKIYTTSSDVLTLEPSNTGTIALQGNTTIGGILTVTGAGNSAFTGSISTGSTFAVSGTSTFTGLSTFSSGINVNGQTLTNLVGDGLTVSGTTLEATLGTTVDLTSEVSGTLPVTNGGTGRTSFTSGSILYGNGSSLLGASAVGTSGQCLKSGAAGAPTWGACSSGGVTGSGTANTIALFTSTGSVIGDSLLSQNGTEVVLDGTLRIDPVGTGNVNTDFGFSGKWGARIPAVTSWPTNGADKAVGYINIDTTNSYTTTFKVGLTGSWSSGASMGRIEKTYSLYFNGTTISNSNSQTSMATGVILSKFSLGEPELSGGKLRVPVYRLNTTTTTAVTVDVEVFSPATSSLSEVLDNLTVTNPTLGANSAVANVLEVDGEEICLENGNCAGANGYGDITGTGSANTLAIFDAAKNIVNSIITQSGGAINIAGDLNVNGGDISVDQDELVYFRNINNSISADSTNSLEVRAFNNQRFYLDTNNNNTSYFDIYGDVASGTTTNPLFRLDDNGVFDLQNAVDTTTAYQFRDADGGTPILNIDTTNERIGIGTDSPEYSLHVDGGSGYFETDSGATPLIVSRTYKATNKEELSTFVDDSSLNFDYINDEASATIRFNIENTDTEGGGGASASDREVLTLRSNNSGAFVGVNKAAPTATLDVNGSTALSSTLTVGGASTFAGLLTANAGIDLNNSDLDDVQNIYFDESNSRIYDNASGLIFDGGDGNPDLLVYDNIIYSDQLRLGYSGSAQISTYDTDEDLTLNTNGTGDIILNPGGAGGYTFVSNGTFYVQDDTVLRGNIYDTTGNLSLNDTVDITGALNVTGLSTFSSGINVNGQTLTNLAGDGLTVSGTTLEATLGTTVDLSSAEVSGTLPVTRGGTGRTSFTAGSILYGNGSSLLGASAVGTSGQCLKSGASGAPTWGACSSGGVTGSGTANTIALFTSTGSVIGDSVITQSGANVEIIGTLRVTGSIGSIYTSGSGNDLNFTRAGSNYIRSIDPSGSLRLGTNDNGSVINIQSDEDVAIHGDTLFIDASTSRVGIGTTSIGANKLRVEGGYISVNNAEPGAGELRLGAVYGDPGIYTNTAGKRLYLNSGAASNGISFGTNGDNERLIVDNGGNVGIGSSTYDDRLEISGGNLDISTGNLELNDITRISNSGALTVTTGTFTGNLNGTSATFSGAVTASSTLSVSGTSTLSGLLSADGGIDVDGQLRVGSGQFTIASNGVVFDGVIANGSQTSQTLITGFVDNELTNYTLRGGTLAASTTGGATVSNPDRAVTASDGGTTTRMTFASPGNLVLELTGVNLPVYADSASAPFIQMRSGQNPTGVKVEYRESDNTTWVEVANDTSPDFGGGVWYKKSFAGFPGYPITGVRFTLTYSGTATSYIAEFGVAMRNTQFGSHSLAQLNSANTFYANNIFSGAATFNGNLTVQAGDTITINGDAFTDLTGTGLSIDGSGVLNVTPGAGGVGDITGSGSANTLAMFDAAKNIVNSVITQSGSAVTIAGSLTTTGSISGANGTFTGDVSLGNGATDQTTIDGLLDVRTAAGYQQEGQVLLGRIDGTNRDSFIRYYNDTPAANNYVKIAVHNGTLGASTDALIAYGDGSVEIGIGGLRVTGTTAITDLDGAGLTVSGTTLRVGAGSCVTVNSGNVAVTDGCVNAGTLDGLDSTDFFRENLGDIATDFDSYVASGSHRVVAWSANSIANGPIGSYDWGQLRVTQFGGPTYVTQEYLPHNTENSWTRTFWGGSWTSWRETWGSGNDGSGSGLDADLLDGQTGGYYTNASNLISGTLADARLSSSVALLSGAQTFTGVKTFSGALTASSTLTVSGTSTFVGLSTFASGIRVNNQTLTNLVGDGLTLSGTTLTTTLGTTVDLSSAEVSGTLPVTRGGTGRTSFTAGSILYGNGTGLLGVSPIGTSGQCLKSGASGAPSWGPCSSGGVTGSGTANTIALFTSTGSVIGNSILTQSGSDIDIAGGLTVDSDLNVVSTGDSVLRLTADTASGSETNNAYIEFSQDAGAITSTLGTVGGSNIGPDATAYTGALNNGTLLGTTSNSALQLGVNNSVDLTISTGHSIGIGDTTPDAKLDIQSTSNQLRVSYNDSNYAGLSVNSSGNLTIAPSGGQLNVTGNLDVSGHGAFGGSGTISDNYILNVSETLSEVANVQGIRVNVVNDADGGGTLSADNILYGINVSANNTSVEDIGGGWDSDTYGGYFTATASAARTFRNLTGNYGRAYVTSDASANQGTAIGTLGTAQFNSNDAAAVLPNAYGVQGYVQGSTTGGGASNTLNNARGLYGVVYPYATNVTNAYGSYNRVQTINGYGGSINTAYGTYNVIRVDSDDGGDINTAYAGRFDINKRAGANNVNTGYGLYVNVDDSTNAYGLRVFVDDPDTVSGYGIRISVDNASSTNYAIFVDEGDIVLDADGNGSAGGTGAGGDLILGEGQDLELYHNGTDSYIQNNTGQLRINSAAGIRAGGQLIVERANHQFALHDTNTGATEWTLSTVSDQNFGIYENGVTQRLLLTTAGNLTVNGVDVAGTGNITDFDGDGLTLSGTTLTTTLGTTVDLSSAEVSGTLPVTNGGTGRTSFTSGSILYGNGSSLLGASAVGTSGQCLKSGASGAPTWGACSSGGVTGSGTANTIALFTSTGSVIGNSILTQSGSTITVGGTLALGANNISNVSNIIYTNNEQPGSATDGQTYYDLNNAGDYTEFTDGGGLSVYSAEDGWGAVYSTSNDQFATPNFDGLDIGTSGARLLVNSTSVVINEVGSSRDFRVEGTTDVNLLFVDGSADNVGIGTNTPSSKLQVAGEFNADVIKTGGFNVERVIAASFPNGVANQKFDIYVDAYWGELDITLTSGYSNQNASGAIQKKFFLGLNPSNAVYSNESRYSEVGGVTANNFAISDLTWDAANSRYRIQIVHRASTGNAIKVTLKAKAITAAHATAIANAGYTSVYTTDTAVFATPEVNFNSDVTIDDTLTVTGATVLSSSLAVTGTSTFTGLVTVNGGIDLNNSDLDDVQSIYFDESNSRIYDNSSGLLFDGGDGAIDLIVYDNLIRSDTLRLGYSGAAQITTEDTNESLAINTNGTGAVNINAVTNISGILSASSTSTFTGLSTFTSGINVNGQTLTNLVGDGLTVSGTTLTTTLGTTVDLSSAEVSGTLPVTNGGTGRTSFTSGSILYGNGSSLLGASAVGTSGQCLKSGASGAPTWGACSSGGVTGSGTANTIALFTSTGSVIGDSILTQTDGGTVLNIAGQIDSNGKRVFNTHDAWLRINPLNEFASGIYAGSSILRTDGQLQVGTSGANFLATTAGVVINDVGGNADLRVEGDTNAYLLFVDAGVDRVGVGTGSPDTVLDVNGAISVRHDTTTVRSYKDVYHANYNAAQTGTYEIVMPGTWSSTMMVAVIRGYDYSGGNDGGAWEVVVGGYNYSGVPNWHNTSVEIRGSAPFDIVRLAHDGTNNVILLGDTSTAWSYPKVTVEQFTATHGNVDGWGDGWTGSFITSEAGITNIATPEIQLYQGEDTLTIGGVSGDDKLEVVGGNIDINGALEINDITRISNTGALTVTTGAFTGGLTGTSGTFSGAVSASSLSGNGASITALNASNIATGTLNDDRLSASVSLLDVSQIHTAETRFDGGSGTGYGQAAIEIYESNVSGTSPRLSFHYGGSVASQIGFFNGDTSGDISVINQTGSGYETIRVRDLKIGSTQFIDGSRNIVNGANATFAGDLAVTGNSTFTGLVTANSGIDLNNSDLDDVQFIYFDQSNSRIADNGNGLLFDGGDGTNDLLIYDNRIYSDALRLGYSGSALIDTYDVNENLTLSTNGTGSIILNPGTTSGYTHVNNGTFYVQNSTILRGNVYDDTGNLSLNDTVDITGALNVTGLSTFSSGINVNGQTLTNLVGDGLTVSGTTLEATLGTTVDLSSAEVSGTLPVTRGGTGRTSFTAGSILYGNGTGLLGVSPIGTSGQCLKSGASGAPSWGPCSSGGVTGSGTANTIALFTSTGSVIGNSILTQSGSTVTAAGSVAANVLAASSANETLLTIDNSSGGQSRLSIESGGTEYWRVGAQGTAGNNFFINDVASGNNILDAVSSNGQINLGNSSSRLSLIGGSAGIDFQATTGGYTFNDGGFNNDFRIEGENNINLFVLDASADNIGIGTATPDATLDVSGDFRIAGQSNSDDTFLKTGEFGSSTNCGTTAGRWIKLGEGTVNGSYSEHLNLEYEIFPFSTYNNNRVRISFAARNGGAGLETPRISMTSFEGDGQAVIQNVVAVHVSGSGVTNNVIALWVQIGGNNYVCGDTQVSATYSAEWDNGPYLTTQPSFASIQDAGTQYTTNSYNFSGELDIQGNVSIGSQNGDDRLEVTGGNLDINGNLEINDITRLSNTGALTVTTGTFSGLLAANAGVNVNAGDLTVSSGDVYISTGNLLINNPSGLGTEAVQIRGNIEFTDIDNSGLRSLWAPISIYGDTNNNDGFDLVVLGGNGNNDYLVINDSGNTEINGDLSVTGASSFTGLVTATGGISINGETFTDLTGTGLVASGNTLTTTLGTSVSLTSEITGTLAVSNGGTGATSFTQSGVVYGNGAGALAATAQGTSGQCLVSNGAAAPTWGGCDATAVTGSGSTDSLALFTGGTVVGSSVLSQSSGTLNSAGDLTVTSDSTSAFRVEKLDNTPVLVVDTTTNSAGGTLAIGGDVTDVTGSNEVLIVQGNIDPALINFSSSNTGSYGALFRGVRSRGTNAAPTPVINNDELFQFDGVGYVSAGSNFSAGVQLLARVDGAPTTTSVPGEFVVRTRNTSGSLADRLVVRSTGAVEVSGYIMNGSGTLNILDQVRIDEGGSSYDVWIQGGGGSGDNRNLALLGIDEDSGDYLVVNYNKEYAQGVTIGGTSAPSGTELYVSTTTAADGAQIGSAFIGNFNGGSTEAVFAHDNNRASSLYYALKQTSAGTTSLNSIGIGGFLNFQKASVTVANIDPAGDFNVLNKLKVTGRITSSEYVYSRGYMGRAGTSGSNSNIYNHNWTGTCAAIWIDTTNIGNYKCASDERVKKDIAPLATLDGLSAISQLNPVSFDWKSGDDPTGLQYGFLAQEVQSIFPELVHNTGMITPLTPDGMLSLNYEGLISITIKGIQQLDIKVEDHSDRLLDLESVTTDITKYNLTVTNVATIDTLVVTATATIDTLTVTGITTVQDLVVEGRIITAGDLPTAVLGVATGDSGSFTLEGNDTAGSIVITTGTDTLIDPVIAGEQVTIEFDTAYDEVPRVVVTPSDANSATSGYFVAKTEDGFTIHFTETPLELTDYSFDYVVIQ